MKVESTSPWVASVVVMEGADDVYLRLNDDSSTLWYVLVNEKWEWIQNTKELGEAWAIRGGIPFENIQTSGG